jgi:hypothetical protein
MRAPTGPLARSLTTPVQTVVATWQALVRQTRCVRLWIDDFSATPLVRSTTI